MKDFLNYYNISQEALLYNTKVLLLKLTRYRQSVTTSHFLKTPSQQQLFFEKKSDFFLSCVKVRDTLELFNNLIQKIHPSFMNNVKPIYKCIKT